MGKDIETIMRVIRASVGMDNPSDTTKGADDSDSAQQTSDKLEDISQAIKAQSASSKKQETELSGLKEAQTQQMLGEAKEDADKMSAYDEAKNNSFKSISSVAKQRAIGKGTDVLSKALRTGFGAAAGDLGALSELAQNTILHDPIQDLNSIVSQRQATQNTVENLTRGGLNLSKEERSLIANYQENLHATSRDNIRDAEEMDGKDSWISTFKYVFGGGSDYIKTGKNEYIDSIDVR